MRSRTYIFFVASLSLAFAICELFVPTPNAAHGGAARMFILIFLTVGFNVLFGLAAARWDKKRGKRPTDSSP
jgi:hypothetical protein